MKSPSSPAVIQAQIVEMRVMKTDKMLRLSVEIPQELAEQFVQEFGYPRHDAPIPVAVARLVEEPEEKPEPPKEKRQVTLAQKVAMTCQEWSFEKFIADQKYGAEAPLHPGEVEQYVRHYCGVASRSQIIDGTPAAEKWRSLEAAYRKWQLER